MGGARVTVRILTGDCREVLATLPDESVDSIVTDPPYGLAFMGKDWDGDVPPAAVWRECLRVLKPGGYLLAFAGTRTQHRMAVRIEDAGFEIRDMIAWVYGSGFPKSLDVSNAIDKAAGAIRERRDEPATDAAARWQGWGTALKPALEPITVARKPLIGTVAENVLAHGTGALNIDGCLVDIDVDADAAQLRTMRRSVRPAGSGWGMSTVAGDSPQVLRPEGRWPANLIHDGSDEVLALFPQAPGQLATASSSSSSRKNQNVYGAMARGSGGAEPRGDAGSAARFFYCAKASKADRGEGNTHPTVKPTALMRYLCRLVTPPGGTVLDPFAGSGSTLIAAEREGFDSIGIELNPEYVAIARRRIEGDAPLFSEIEA